MNELFDTIGQPRNYDLRAQDGQDQESEKDEDGSPFLCEERLSDEEMQRAENPEEWVGSTAAHSV